MQFDGGITVLKDGLVVERTDSSLSVWFFYHPVLLEKASEEAGIPKYTDVEMIGFMIPGDRNSVIHRKVKDEDKIRFKEKYERFKQTAESKIEGTPLNQFHFISAAQIKELEYFNIYTAEQLVSIPDGNIDRLGSKGREMVMKVKATLDSAKDASFVTKITSENEKLKKEMDLLKEQMAQISERFGNSGETSKSKPKITQIK